MPVGSLAGCPGYCLRQKLLGFQISVDAEETTSAFSNKISEKRKIERTRERDSTAHSECAEGVFFPEGFGS